MEGKYFLLQGDLLGVIRKSFLGQIILCDTLEGLAPLRISSSSSLPHDPPHLEITTGRGRLAEMRHILFLLS